MNRSRSFNSTLVQLKEIEDGYFMVKRFMFQFYLSSIKRFTSTLAKHGVKQFQFYLSSIKRVVPHENCVDRKMFQFYLSSIKSR